MPTAVQWGTVTNKLMVPLLLSPLISLVGTVMLYPLLRRTRIALGLTKQSCFCAGVETIETVPHLTHELALARIDTLSTSLGTAVTCEERYDGRVVGIDCAAALDAGHYMSAGLMSFARGLNDTPKIAALFLVAPNMTPLGALALCGGTIAIGGLIGSHRVADTMSHRITTMNASQAIAFGTEFAP